MSVSSERLSSNIRTTHLVGELIKACMSEHSQEFQHDGDDSQVADQGRETGQEVVEVTQSGGADDLLHSDCLEEQVLDFLVDVGVDSMGGHSSADAGDKDRVHLKCRLSCQSPPRTERQEFEQEEAGPRCPRQIG